MIMNGRNKILSIILINVLLFWKKEEQQTWSNICNCDNGWHKRSIVLNFKKIFILLKTCIKSRKHAQTFRIMTMDNINEILKYFYERF